MIKWQSAIPVVLKEPGETWPYGFDWTAVVPDGETIESSIWEIETIKGAVTVELLAGSDTIDGLETAAAFKLGAIGEKCYLKNTIETSPSEFTGVRRIEMRIARR